MRKTTRRREERQSNGKESFRFAITLLVALGTVIYILYNYLQNNSVDYQMYLLICGVVFFALILAIFLLLYLLIEGYSLEVHDNPDLQKHLKDYASAFYLSVLLMSVILLIAIVIFFVFNFFIQNKTFEIALLIMVSFVLILNILLYIAWKKGSKKMWNIVLIVDTSFLSFIIISLILSNLFYITPLQGHLMIDMESIYHKNDAPIPVSIRTTGPSTNITVLLVFASNQTLEVEDEITLNPDYPSSTTSLGKFLFGNTLGYGIYSVFINTTDLIPGYYELHCLRWLSWKTFTVRRVSWKTSSARNFYLVNSSQQPSLEEINAS